ncbi:Nuclear GTPase SLIP-GC [Colletotrichum sp. SAR 10_66]|nr:Nuclear GTPase SLIP-GC [Colletotrichum sp. SAR 10_76]KAJ4999769.1 Nuclear GTPase SLIP-GC [Colletotrichum sp. SAR 10_66]
MGQVKMELETEPNVGGGPKPSANMIFSILNRLKIEKDPKVWEKHVGKVLPVLDKLKPVCESIACSSKLNVEIKTAATNWLKNIDDVRERASQTNKIIIGVFGNTGDGKSSTINALLGEGSLLPTNCMRACTACVTEISFNHDDDSEKPYRAEIDFVCAEVWQSEIETFLKEVAINNDGFEDDDENADTEAAKSVARARAVYANMDVEVLQGSTVPELMRHPNVHEVLGATRHFKASSGEELRFLIEPYVDSSDKDDEDAIGFWPMVKAVRIFTRAKALSNGVTIVDLPGSHDADAARASIASDYMKSCAGIWIVSPIHRAVDNKAAKDLMSDAFKRQLRVDGSFSNVTFICSKTDQLSVEDAVKNFKNKLDADTKSSWDKSKEHTKRIKFLEKEIRGLRQTGDAALTSDDDSDLEPSAKRQRKDPSEKKEKADKLSIKMKELKKVKAKRLRLVEAVTVACIQKRNDISCETLRGYFGRILNEAQQHLEAANRTDSGLEFDDVAELPVFCTSSLAYQRLEGLSDGDADSVIGFNDVEDTEIPALQKHAQSLTEELRIGKNREVLAGVCQILNSISLWTQNVPDFAAALDADTLNSLLANFEIEIMSETDKCVEDLRQSLDEGLLCKMVELGNQSKAKAGDVAMGWFTPPGNGGVHHSTLKATFVRGGVWKTLDLNEELLQEYSSKVFDDWVETFRMVIPSSLDDFLLEILPQLKSFHKAIMDQLGEDEGGEVMATQRLREQLELHKEAIKRLIAQSKVDVNEAQKKASREPLQVVRENMQPAYVDCVNETGPGCKKRMKASMNVFMHARKHEMFQKAISTPTETLEEAINAVVEKVESAVKAISQTMRTDYTIALAKREESSRREEADFKKDMMGVLELAEPLLK